MKVGVRMFARARDVAGADRIEVEIPDGSRIVDLRRALVATHPALAPLAGHLLFAVDSEYAVDATPVPGSAELACFPPVSGG